jgi:cbb3-type cytochrome oxidase subunit 3
MDENTIGFLGLVFLVLVIVHEYRKRKKSGDPNAFADESPTFEELDSKQKN